jgi:hypothetical protein
MMNALAASGGMRRHIANLRTVLGRHSDLLV